MRRSVAFALALTLAGCGKSQAGDGTELRPNLGLDLSRVVGFVIAGDSTQLPAAAGPADAGDGGGELYALDEDGTLTITTVTEEGENSRTVEPIAVFDTPLYLFFMFGNVSYQGESCNLIPVRKSDGAMYCIGNLPHPGPAVQEIDFYFSAVQSDATGNIVWVAHDRTLTRLDLTDPELPTVSHPLDTSALTPGHVLAQVVNPAGDALVSWTLGERGERFTRVLLAGGGFVDVSDHDWNCMFSGPAANPNDFYADDNIGPLTGDDVLVKLTRAPAGTTFERTELGPLPWADCDAGLVKTSTRAFLTGLLDPPTSIIAIADDQAAMITVGAPLTKITRIAGHEDALFILGTGSTGAGGIVRYDIAEDSFTTLLEPGPYSVSRMDVSPGGDVTFYGQRAADGAFILGNIPAGASEVTVIATGLPPVSQIRRIH